MIASRAALQRAGGGPLARMLVILPAALVVAALPLWAPSLYVTNIAILALFFAVASTGLNIIYGYAGLLSFAQVGFWGLGGYASALIATELGWSPWIAFLLAGLVAGVVAVMIGGLALRVSRDAFVIVSLSFTLLLQLLARNWTGLTRGPMGIPGLPAPSVALPFVGSLSGHDPKTFYWIALAFAVAVLCLIHRILRSRIGRTLLAIKHDEALARSQGISVIRYQLLAFVLSALLGGLAGGLYVFHLTIVDPTIFDAYYTQMLLIIVILGGPGYFWPVLCASAAVTVLPEILRMAPDLRMVLFGFVLVVAIQFFPQGAGGYLAARNLRKWKAPGR